MPRTKDDKLEKKRRHEILEAAACCFVREGFHQASMRSICAEAGLSAGAVYNYFPSKDAIIEGMADWEREEIGELAAYMRSEQNALTAVVEGARAMVAETSADDAQLYAELIAEAGRNAAMRARFGETDRALVSLLEETVARGQKAGTITRREKAPALARMVMAVYEGFIGRIGPEKDNGPKKLASLAADAIRMILKP